MKYLRWIFFAALLISGKSWALLPWVPTDEEFKVLPPYCWAKMKAAEGSPEKIMWRQSLGEDFVHVHHYCAALNFANRYYRERDAQSKKHWYNQAVDNYNYMVNQADPKFSLMPDIYYYRGQIQASSKNYPRAQLDLLKAIELNPGIPKSYSLLADIYVELKNAKKALEVVTEGLRHNPSSKSLQKAYTKFGGALPFPEPYVTTKSEPPLPEQKGSAPSGAPASPSDEVKSDEKVVSPSVPPVTVDEGAKADKAQPPAPVKGDGKIGEVDKGKNPWCRFCP